jgi:TRAP transporter 4TM/12TM fusion protein
VEKIVKLLIAVITFGVAFQSIYTAFFGVWHPTIHRPLIMALGALGAILMRPLVGMYSTKRQFIKALLVAIDLVLLVIILGAVYYFLDISEELEEGLFELDIKIYYLALGGILVLLELTRRFFGLPLLIVGGLCLIYVLFGEHLPGVLRHSGYDIESAMQDIWFTTTGVFGLPMAILLNLVFIFIVFGTVLEGTGAGDVMLKFAFAATGRSRGGPAHAAIVASALFGTMSGSVMANVVGTGTMTIPMIKKRGFSSNFAGAVEAAASTGGQIMPPVMGIGAFMMAEFTGISYLYIIVAAAIPAILYYASLFIAVSLEAKRLGIEPLSASEKVKLTKTDYIQSLMFFAPILAIIVTLISGRSAAMAGFAAVITTILFAVISPEFRAQPQRLFHALCKGGAACVYILIAVGTLGVVIGAMDLTGVGIRFAQLIADLAGEGLFPALLLTMAACLFMGMGMPTVPAYIVVVLVLGPAIKMLGMPLLVIHMFVFYYGVLSCITPPVALAAYAAAPIAGSNPVITGIVSVRLAFIAFIIPFVFLYNPQLLIISAATGGAFEPLTFIWVLFRVLIALWLFTTALTGMDRHKLSALGKLLRMAAGVSLLVVGAVWQVAGLVLAFVVLAEHYLFAPRRAAKPALDLNC